MWPVLLPACVRKLAVTRLRRQKGGAGALLQCLDKTAVRVCDNLGAPQRRSAQRRVVSPTITRWTGTGIPVFCGGRLSFYVLCRCAREMESRSMDQRCAIP